MTLESIAAFVSPLALPWGGWEIVIILLAVLILFGGRKLPELARGLGRGLREFRTELRGLKEDPEDEGSQPRTEGGNEKKEEKT